VMMNMVIIKIQIFLSFIPPFFLDSYSMLFKLKISRTLTFETLLLKKCSIFLGVNNFGRSRKQILIFFVTPLRLYCKPLEREVLNGGCMCRDVKVALIACFKACFAI
jgi:hypothetical protein